jgi:hypothetical protein
MMKMFDWFGRKSDYTNVVKFPEQVKNPVPYIEAPKAEEVHYSIGITSEDRIALRIGYSTLTMNKEGCENLIEQLEVFVKQLTQKETDA